MCFILGKDSQLIGPYVHIPHKNSTWIMNFGSQNCLWGSCWGSYCTRNLIFLSKLLEDQQRRLNKPHLSARLWESEASCWLYSTLGQTRNHSPGWEPPILKDVGHLEQEQPSIKRWHHWAPQNPHLQQWVMGRLQKTDMVLLAQICTKPHAPDNHRSGKCMWHVKIF